MFQICFLGGGKMASAILGGIVANESIPIDGIHVVEKVAAARSVLKERFPSLSVSDGVELAKIYLVATKPHDVPVVARSLRTLVDESGSAKDGSPIVVSIAAGITVARLEELFGHGFRVVRTMPNTAVAVKSGVVAICDDGRDADALQIVEGLFVGLAQSFRVAEDKIDAITAISGSGPAYFMYIVEAIEEAGVAIGLNAKLARELATLTMAGSADLLAETGTDPRQLRLEVTSPGGTTAQAIRTFDRGALRSVVTEGIIACYQRAQELG